VHGSWYVLDGAAGVFLLVVTVVGLMSVVVSPSHFAVPRRSFFGERIPKRGYYAAFLTFWAALLAIPIVDNLAVAWVLIEATTAASALLVASGGRGSALEAGWKYLVLTTLGLTVALMGILILYVGLADRGTSLGTSLGTVDWQSIRAGSPRLSGDAGVLALVLILAGLATKIGWAPVHNWLPDAHSEAPPPVSALLSAALLPAVVLVAWRVKVALDVSAGHAATVLFLGFGLASVAVAVPFLWRPLPLKRLLAYSSLEHMGVLALGIGFANPLATAGVVLHVAGHALAKSLGFYASIPLLQADATIGENSPMSLASASPAGATAAGVSLAALSGLPPSPLFLSEVLIMMGGVASGHTAVVVATAFALALGFLGMAHAFIEGVAGDAEAWLRRPWSSDRPLVVLTVLVSCALIALVGSGYWLEGSTLVRELMNGVT
jgi:hydrogenase-4 component F